MLKIQPTIDWIKRQQLAGDEIRLYVGLRADEEERAGIYSSEITSIFPMREWGWGVRDVWAYLARQKVAIPRRTDCARCYDQRIGEWYLLWRDYPEIYASAVAEEVATGHTFRSKNGGGKWPAPLQALAAEFARGNKPKTVRDAQQALFPEMAAEGKCRVCSLRITTWRMDYRPKAGSRIDPYRDLLGRMSDREIAHQLGLHRSTVRWLRQRAGIKAVRP